MSIPHFYSVFKDSHVGYYDSNRVVDIPVSCYYVGIEHVLPILLIRCFSACERIRSCLQHVWAKLWESIQLHQIRLVPTCDVREKGTSCVVLPLTLVAEAYDAHMYSVYPSGSPLVITSWMDRHPLQRGETRDLVLNISTLSNPCPIR